MHQDRTLRSPSMFCFCSNSPSVMVKLSRDCLKTKEFSFSYGCAPHAIYNLCMDRIKNFDGVKHVLKQILFMVKIIKLSHLLKQLPTSSVWRNITRRTCSFFSRRIDGEPYYTPRSMLVQLRRRVPL